MGGGGREEGEAERGENGGVCVYARVHVWSPSGRYGQGPLGWGRWPEMPRVQFSSWPPGGCPEQDGPQLGCRNVPAGVQGPWDLRNHSCPLLRPGSYKCSLILLEELSYSAYITESYYLKVLFPSPDFSSPISYCYLSVFAQDEGTTDTLILRVLLKQDSAAVRTASSP